MHKYDPSVAERFVHRVPMYHLYEGRMGPHDYVLRVVGGGPEGGGCKQVVALHDLHRWSHGAATENPISKRVIPWLERAGVRVHSIDIKPKRSFANEGKESLIRASQILEDAVRNGIPTAVTCELGQRRSGRALYLMHRRLGASHEEAMELGKPNSDEGELLRQLYEERITKKH